MKKWYHCNYILFSPSQLLSSQWQPFGWYLVGPRKLRPTRRRVSQWTAISFLDSFSSACSGWPLWMNTTMKWVLISHLYWHVQCLALFGAHLRFISLHQHLYCGATCLSVLEKFEVKGTKKIPPNSPEMFVFVIDWIMPFIVVIFLILGGRGSSVGRAPDSWWGGPGFDCRCGRPLPTGWVGVSIMWPAETEAMVFQLCLMCGST